MLFLQCVTVLSLLLILGLGIGYVARMQGLSMEKEALIETARQAASTLEAGETPQSLQPLTEGKKILIQVLYPDGIVSVYTDEKWQPLVSMPADKTRASEALRRSGETPETMERYFSKASLRVYTLFVRLGAEDKDGVLLVHDDISRLNEAFRQIALWTLAICVVAAFVVLFSSYFIAKRIINPFVDMNHIVQCYSKGDFSQRIPVQGKDEASQLGRSFNEMADQLKNLEVTRQSFVANVSHELRSPLTSMKGFLEAMMDGTIPPEEHEHYIDIVLSETRRMTAMVNDLLDLARIESGIITVNYEVFDINELIRRTLITFEARISEKNMELDVRFANEQSFVYADSNQISQVLRNLIDNAIKYSPQGRTLLVSTYALRKEVYVTIRDTGVGIPAEDVPHIFDRFYKVEKAHTPSPQVGSGLGLAIVKKIIEAHGQSITVKSARGKGTQFTFTLEKAITLKRVTDGGRKNGSIETERTQAGQGRTGAHMDIVDPAVRGDRPLFADRRRVQPRRACPCRHGPGEGAGCSHAEGDAAGPAHAGSYSRSHAGDRTDADEGAGVFAAAYGGSQHPGGLAQAGA
ncbi:MAG: HAMP domain-containing protein, partial [Clostridia bacterium]|nr:HAMP domain-containing protein [Clostridia bacterium]